MKRQSKPKLKGTVLFTVISVMSLLIIFLTGTLVLAASASNRAHKNYSSSQTEYTSRTAIDSVLNAIKVDNAFANAICAVSETSGPLSVPVTIESSTANLNSMGKVNDVTVEYYGKKQYYNQDTNAWEEKDLLKVTASVTLGGQTSTSSAYLVKDPPKADNNASGGAGFVTTGGTEFFCELNPFGGTYVNIPTLAVARTYNYLDPTKDYLSTYQIDITNTPVIEADFVVNGSFEIQSAFNGFIFPYEGTGVSIWGDLLMGETGNNFVKSSNCDTSGTYNFNKIPYIYVDNAITNGVNPWSGSLYQVKVNIGSSDKPLNIFCGSINITNCNDFNVNADMYCMDAGVTSVIDSVNTSTLSSWTSSVVNKTNGQNGNYVSGNLFSKGNLYLDKTSVTGDVRAEGDVTIAHNVTIGGDLVVGGTLTVLPNPDNTAVPCTIDITGNIYCDNVVGFEVPAPTLKAGYSTRQSFYHPETYVLDDDKQVEYEIIYNQRYEYYYDSTTNQYSDINGTVYPADIMAMYASWGLVNQNIDAFGTPTVNAYGQPDYYYYVKLDRNGNPVAPPPHMGGLSSYDLSAYSFYVSRRIGPAADIGITRYDEVGETHPVYYTIQNYDGTDSGVVTTETLVYYRDTDQQIVPYDEAMSFSVTLLPLTAYVDSLGNPKDIYPIYAEKDVLLGLTQLADATTGNLLNVEETQVVMTMEDILDDVVNPYKYANIPTKFQTAVQDLRNTGEIINDVYELRSEMGTVATSLYDASGNLNIQYTPYTGQSKAIPVINKNCIIDMPWGIDASAFPGGVYPHDERALVINPGSSEICVVIDALSLQSGTKILIDDSQGGSVHLYVSDGSTMSLQDGTIMTTEYYKLFKDGTDFEIYLNSSARAKDAWGNVMNLPTPNSPNLYIYGGVGSKLQMGNFVAITGYILSPNLNLDYDGTASEFTANNIYYNNYKIDNNKPIVIGCLNASTVESANLVNCLYLADSTGGTPIATPDATHWFKILYYDEY